eukprot:2425728-Amphidinium_carterae.1
MVAMVDPLLVRVARRDTGRGSTGTPDNLHFQLLIDALIIVVDSRGFPIQQHICCTGVEMFEQPWGVPREFE